MISIIARKETRIASNVENADAYSKYGTQAFAALTLLCRIKFSIRKLL